jgi:hypothetical protein
MSLATRSPVKQVIFYLASNHLIITSKLVIHVYTVKPHTSELPVRRTPQESEHFCSVPNVLLYIMYNAKKDEFGITKYPEH